MIFVNRIDAGKQLARQLIAFMNKEPIIFAIPRGGVPVGFVVAEILHAPLEVLVVRKISVLHNPEFGIGAIAEGNIRILDKPAQQRLPISQIELEEIIRREKIELKRRVSIYRNDKPFPRLKNKTAILVDDGLATGVTARAAITSLKKRKPKHLVFASSVCAYDAAEELRDIVDSVICVIKPVDFRAVGQWYSKFNQVSDEEVIALLWQNRTREKSVDNMYQEHQRL